MTSIPVSDNLARIVARSTVQNAELVRAYETGIARTKNAATRLQRHVSHFARQLIPCGPRKRPSSPDRLASLYRKRSVSGPSEMPEKVRGFYTPGEQACMVIVANEIMKHGQCDLCIDKIAALAGVGRTTVQNALRKGCGELAHVSVEARPRPGLKNLTNIIRIVSSEWLVWLRNRIGFKKPNATKKHAGNLSQSQPGLKLQEALETERAGRVVRRHRMWIHADGLRASEWRRDDEKQSWNVKAGTEACCER